METVADASRQRPITLKDVARQAGVSASTASRALNGSARRVDDHLRQRVLTAADALGYTPNVMAQAVARGSSTTVALLISYIDDPYFSTMAAEMMRAAEEGGFRVTISVTERRVDREIDLIRELRGQHPQAIVIAGSVRGEPFVDSSLIAELRMYEETGGTVVMVSRTDLPFPSIAFDNRGGAYRLAVELADLGYERFLVLSDDSNLVMNRDRVDGFVAGLRERDILIPHDRVLYEVFSWEGGYQAVSRLDDAVLAETQLIFAANDVMALGALAALRARGIAVPESIAVAGFDDISTLRDVVPELTSVRIPLDEVGREAIRRATDPDYSDGHPVIPATVVIRASTPGPRR